MNQESIISFKPLSDDMMDIYQHVFFEGKYASLISEFPKYAFHKGR